MKEELRHVINKLILPKYPSITGVYIGVSYGKRYDFYDVFFHLKKNNDNIRFNVGKETKLLFQMLGHGESSNITIHFFSLDENNAL